MALIQFDPLQFRTGNPLSASDVNTLADNARLIDQLANRGRRAFTGATIKWAYEYDQQPTVVMRGAFQYRAGVTNLNIVAEAAFPGGGTHTMRVYLNGILRYSTTWLTARTTYFFNITGYGFADLDIVEVEVRDDWSTADGEPVVIDAYIDAMSAVAGTYTAPTAFGDISQANLESLMAAQQWCMDRLNITDQPCLMGPMFITGYGYLASPPQEMLLFDGSIEYTNSCSRLIIGLRYQVIAVQSERVAVRINGTQVLTQDFSFGQTGEIGFDIDLSSYATDTPLRLTIIQTVLTPPLAGVRQLGTRYTITDIYTRRATFTAPTLPAVYSPRQSLTFSALQTALGQIRTATINAVNRIGSGVGAFNRQRLFRWRPGVDDGQNEYFTNVLVARGRRAHDALWVRGKGLRIAYGPITVEQVPDGLYKWEAQYEQELTPGDAVQTKLVYFDNFPGLDAGMEYYILGPDIRYAAEAVRA